MSNRLLALVLLPLALVIWFKYEVLR